MGPYIFLDLYELLFIGLNSKENHRQKSSDISLQGATSRLEETCIVHGKRIRKQELHSVHGMCKEKTETIVAAV